MVEELVPPAVRADGRWELIEKDASDLGGKRLVTVRSERVLYGDRELGGRVQAATGIDRLWRSFFTSRLTTTPALTPGIADLVVRTIAGPQAAKRFTTDLRGQGFREVERRDDGQIALETGQRARTMRFSAVLPVDGDGIDVDAWLAIWDRDTHMIVAGGIYPVEPLPVEGGEGLFAPPGEYREELLQLVRAVGAE